MRAALVRNYRTETSCQMPEMSCHKNPSGAAWKPPMSMPPPKAVVVVAATSKAVKSNFFIGCTFQ